MNTISAAAAERLDQALAHIDANPAAWDQNNWIQHTECGTTACIAGWIHLLAGRPSADNDVIEDSAFELLELDTLGNVGHDLFCGGNNRLALTIWRELLVNGNIDALDIHGANLRRAGLTGANFNGANLANVDFNGANLKDATFDGANVNGASFRHVYWGGLNAEHVLARTTGKPIL